MVYNPQRVMRQFGYDQSKVILARELATLSTQIAKARFVGQGETRIARHGKVLLASVGTHKRKSPGAQHLTEVSSKNE